MSILDGSQISLCLIIWSIMHAFAHSLIRLYRAVAYASRGFIAQAVAHAPAVALFPPMYVLVFVSMEG